MKMDPVLVKSHGKFKGTPPMLSPPGLIKGLLLPFADPLVVP